MIEKLEWDSAFFGINIGKLIIYDEKDFDPLLFIKEIEKCNLNLVYVFKFNKMLSHDNILKSKLKLVDIQPTMSMGFDRNAYKDIEYDLKNNLTVEEKDESYKIAEDTAVVSRFYNESLIGKNKTRELYRKWIDNALNKSFSDGLFFEKEVEKVSGIHIIKTDKINKIGFFTLTGVNSDYKRMGIGRKLWLQSFGYWANESEIELVKSPFSFQNSESLNFHLKMGFNKVEEVKYIYHYNKLL
jgi:dTDP-4-amino-4,6-dideoxy-D-galactose acyltransferase